jgi:multidrug efflux pump subunit AcrA (membrane-fusion protein)
MQQVTKRRFAMSIGSVLLLLALGGSILAYRQGKHAQGMADPQKARKEGRPIPVRTAFVTDTDAEQVIGATAVTVPSETGLIRLGPTNVEGDHARYMNLTVKSIFVHEGDRVEHGQFLCELEDKTFRMLEKRRQSDLAAAQSLLKLAKQAMALNAKTRELSVDSATANLHFRVEDLENRKKVYQMYESLHRDKFATLIEYWESRSKYSQASFERTDADLVLQRARNDLLVGALKDRENVAKAEQAVADAATNLAIVQQETERIRIASPLDGIVDYGNQPELIPNQVVEADKTFFQILKLDPLFVRVDFPQERLDEVSVGSKAEIVLDSFPKETYQGKVIRISPQVQPQLRVFPVLVEINNPGNRIKAGITGYVRFHVSRMTPTLPATAVIQSGTKSMAFRIENGRARLREIVTGPAVKNGELELRSGLSPGDEVVIFHNFYRNAGELAKGSGYLQDNDPVDTDWRKWTRRQTNEEHPAAN